MRNRVTPLIGIAAWGVVEGRGVLAGASGGRRDYTSFGLNGGLNQNHSHFILVDNKTTIETHGSAVYGSEILFRAQLEREISSMGYMDLFGSHTRVSCVLLCIQGGPNSLRTTLEAVRVGTPVVLLAGSGGAADILANTWLLVHGSGSGDATAASADAATVSIF